ncbi:dipeptide ABC transporter permease DppC [Celerinatantimonas diazotrophica]|uniref:Dipeptide transport system permease protein n=1 Tax=Celerinatantimonas diazotrophica TaxID=412034 RepID=A0A4R1K445_9GAMM|nr:dipeptide ABC transporter permease DppC [Celerinatantimonas diazotrophica]TCK58687.1 dipeptide transport system permease protein [Celerinatantimonas diazotrophica]CAG9297316.1 Dipeptide transport system permease protein DppC [Celerinatantimonas diazotrophica]
MSEEQTLIQDNSPKPMSPLQEFWFYFRQNKGAVAGLLYIIIIILFALFAEVIAPHSPIQQFQNAFLTPPSWQTGGSTKFLLGTDDVGRDIFSRLIYGARLSLVIGTMVVTISLSCGVLLGLIAGYTRGILDTIIMRIADIMLAVPSLLFAIAIVAILGPSLVNASVAIAIVSIPHFIRLTRASVIAETSRDYVTASQVVGAGALRLMFLTILPNCLAPLIIQATLGFSSALLDMAALGFLGMGAQPPTPEWGSMLANARQYVTRAWWVVTFPGIMILTTVLAFNLMGDGLRDALDPKMKR